MRELQIETNESKKYQRTIFLYTSKESKEFITMCMYRDSFKHDRKDYSNYDGDLETSYLLERKYSKANQYEVTFEVQF